jgi:hypothetical protein
MAIYKALLIQDISQFIELIEPYFNKALEAYATETELEFESALKWLIEEELEQIYGLFGKDHDRYHFPHAAIRDAIDNMTPTPLSCIVAHHIGAPVIDHDHNVVEIRIWNRDLLIEYVPLQSDPIKRTSYITRFHEQSIPFLERNTLFGPAASR